MWKYTACPLFCFVIFKAGSAVKHAVVFFPLPMYQGGANWTGFLLALLLLSDYSFITVSLLFHYCFITLLLLFYYCFCYYFQIFIDIYY